MNKSLITGLLLSFSASSYAVNVTCEFDTAKFTGTDGAFKDKKILIIENLKTTKKNSSMDGSVRATNSDEWIELKTKYRTFDRIFAGNFGDLLVIEDACGFVKGKSEVVCSDGMVFKSAIISKGIGDSVMALFGHCYLEGL